ncbi:MAG TPA: hypothetical protein VFK09_01320 [Gemmatimonadales bacterium]|nr:hypothetical protein [Gemmatimonadales bacterium]
MTQAPQSSPALRRLPACARARAPRLALWCALSLALAAAPLGAQAKRTSSEEIVVRRGVDGVELATVPPGAALRVGKSAGRWTEVTLDGWIIAGSVAPTRREGFDLIVSADAGENLRDAPRGDIVARLNKGVLLRRIGTRRGWVHVRRAGWVREARAPETARAKGTSRPRETAAAKTPPAPSSPDRPAPRDARPAARAEPSLGGPVESAALPDQGTPPPQARARSARPAPGASAPQSPAPGAPAAGAPNVEVARAADLYTQPGAGQLGSVAPGATGQVLARSGDWVRVRLEGWVRDADLKPAADGALVGVTAAEVRADPDRYVGQTVEWRLQFISLQTADELRTELPAGQPFLLTRGPLPEPGFVYVAIARDRAAAFKAVPALQELTVRVRIKAARSRYLATPIVELDSVVSGMPGQ